MRLGRIAKHVWWHGQIQKATSPDEKCDIESNITRDSNIGYTHETR
jgi:hypothetical protein